MEYKDTIFLPKTSFEMRANLPVKEPKILDEWNKKNIYVQGSKVGKNYQLEIVSQQYTDILSIKGVKNLVLLGWNLPFEEGPPNFYKIFSLQEIMDGNASKLIVKSFKFYELGSGEDEVATYSIFSTK